MIGERAGYAKAKLYVPLIELMEPVYPSTSRGRARIEGAGRRAG